MAQLTAAQVAVYARQAGFPQGALADAVAYAGIESGFDPAARSSSGATGLWQILPGGSTDPATNARQAYAKWSACNGGSFACDWTPYDQGPANPNWSHFAQLAQQALGGSSSGGGTTKAGTGVVAGLQVDPFGIGQAIGDFTGRVGATVRTGGLRAMAGGQMLAGLVILGAAVALLAWLWLSRTDSGRAVARGAGRSAEAAATILVVAPK